MYREEELLAERTGNANGSLGSDPSSTVHANGLSTDKPHAAHRKPLTAKELEEAAAKEAALIAADKVYKRYSKHTVMHERCMHGYSLHIYNSVVNTAAKEAALIAADKVYKTL
jgi:hypothetical protein